MPEVPPDPRTLDPDADVGSDQDNEDANDAFWYADEAQSGIAKRVRLSAIEESGADLPHSQARAARHHTIRRSPALVLHSLVRESLLGFLFDPDRALRARAYAFWDAPERLARSLPRRILQLSERLFAAHEGASSPWVHYAAPLLLGLSAKAKSFHSRTSLFPFALGAEGEERPQVPAIIETSSEGSVPGLASSSLKPLFSTGPRRQGRSAFSFVGGVPGDSVMSGAAASLRLGLALGAVRATQVGGAPVFSLTQQSQQHQLRSSQHLQPHRIQQDSRRMHS